jgi:type VI protein secretion system component VasF
MLTRMLTEMVTLPLWMVGLMLVLLVSCSWCGHRLLEECDRLREELRNKEPRQ